MSNEKTLRERIILFASDLFMRFGFGKVTIDEIATGLGMSKKTLYKFFPSKEELLRAGVRFMLQGIARRIEEIISSDKTVTEKLADIMMLIGRQIGKISRLSAINLQKVAPDVWKEIETFRREQILKKMNRLFEQGRREKVFREELNEHVLMLMLIDSVQGILTPDVLSQAPFSAEEAFKTIMKTIFEGALTDEGRKNFHVFDSSISISH
ncbi:MAG: TetR/AcrR family transcriptional regulator [Bacteroidota bacterium]